MDNTQEVSHFRLLVVISIPYMIYTYFLLVNVQPGQGLFMYGLVYLCKQLEN